MLPLLLLPYQLNPTPIMPTPVEPYILSNVTLKLNPKLKLKLAPNLGITDITDILTDGEDITEDGVDIMDDDGDTDIGVKPSDYYFREINFTKFFCEINFTEFDS